MSAAASIRLAALASLLVAGLVARPAVAQAPGAPPPPPPPTYGAPIAPPPYLTLSADDAELIARGEIGEGRLIVGGLVGTLYGYGIGHAIQGRWREKGWIFTVGEVVSGTVFFVGWMNCIDASLEATFEDRRTSCSAAPIWAGLAGLVGFRVWEAVDVWAGARRHNRDVQGARARAGVRFYAAPTGSSSGAAGLSVSF